MMKNSDNINGYRKYEYQETPKESRLVITFVLDNYSTYNQDNVFNDIIILIKNIENINTLSNESIKNINKFLNLATHTRKLDIRNFLV